MSNNETLRVGDAVMWRGGWGADAPARVTVDRITVGGKNSDAEASSVPWAMCVDRWVVVTFRENEHWAYGNQVQPVQPHFGGHGPHRYEGGRCVYCQAVTP